MTIRRPVYILMGKVSRIVSNNGNPGLILVSHNPARRFNHSGREYRCDANPTLQNNAPQIPNDVKLRLKRCSTNRGILAPGLPAALLFYISALLDARFGKQKRK